MSAPLVSSPTELALGTVLHEAADGASTAALLALVATAAQQAMGTTSSVCAVVLGQGGSELTVRATAGAGVALVVPEQLLLTGPAQTSATTGAVSAIDDLRTVNPRWTAWAEQAHRGGVVGVRCWPVRVTGRPVGALVAATTTPWASGSTGARVPRSSAAGQALADVCSVVLQLPVPEQRWSHVLEHLHVPLQDDVVVHQAMGMVAAATAITITDAGAALASHAARLGLPVTDLARQVVDQIVDPADLRPQQRPERGQ